MHVIDENGKQGIVIDGPIVTGDNDEFLHALEKVRDKSNTIVFLSSVGGNGIVAVLIGDLVRRSGMSTAVLEGNDCASGCAMIWIAGVHRIASKNACIGFHGMYDYASGQPSADANAIAGAHLGLLGLSLDAVFWMLTPRQLDTHWLTDETAEKYSIYWTHDKDDPGHSCPNQRGEAHPQTPLPASSTAPTSGATTTEIPHRYCYRRFTSSSVRRSEGSGCHRARLSHTRGITSHHYPKMRSMDGIRTRRARCRQRLVSGAIRQLQGFGERVSVGWQRWPSRGLRHVSRRSRLRSGQGELSTVATARQPRTMQR